MTVNPRSNNIAFCRHLNNSMGPTYKESSGYTGGIKYCLSKFGNIHSQCPLEQWLLGWPHYPCAFDPTPVTCCLWWIEVKWNGTLWSIQVIQWLHQSCPWRPVISSPRQLEKSVADWASWQCVCIFF